MRRMSLFALLFVIPLLLPTLALSAQSEVSGTINGFSCIVKGISCPVDKMDPHLAFENAFVVQMSADKYYLIIDVPLNVLSRLALDKVKIKGEINEKYKTIEPSSIMMQSGDKWVEKWSMAMQRDEMMKLMRP